MGARSRNGRTVFRLFTVVSALCMVYVCFPYAYYFGDYVRQTNPFSGQQQIQQTFTATDAELTCLHGHGFLLQDELQDEQGNYSQTLHGPVDAIPNIVHFIFGLKNRRENPGAGTFGFLEYLALRSAIVSLEPDAIYLHYTYLSEPASADPHADPLTNPWIRRLARDITLVHHDPAPNAAATQYAHLSDTMRLRFLLEHGGIYLDIDSFALRPFDRLLHAPPGRDVVLGAEGGNRWGLCNAIMAARPNSTFVARWLASYAGVEPGRAGWNYHSVILPKRLAEANPGEVCALAPDAFFWPTWTWRHVEWMHEAISADEAGFWAESIRNNSGSLFPNQVAYHAWNQMAWDRHLKKLTPRVVRQKDTRFNLLVRRFMEDDLV
ncbi:hypothetical protein P8C59_008780 [Phyllachora maydis]|uniref:Glycosyl transferase n=1 Tax=Phyllachora maydis TaxID=1825666 RepID=A0AAD9ICI0_9PEZI|nr:hypothetical protein P8C59_008780 [Phyllachora maydis]